MSDLRYVAAPMSRQAIRNWTELIRRVSEQPDKPRFDIAAFVELRLPQLDPAFSFHVDDTLPMDTHACTDIESRSIMVRPEIYEGVIQGKGRDRMTLAHELGHYILHTDVRLLRRMSDKPIEAFRDPEWQAKCFAGELLICRRHLPKSKNPEEVAAIFGVSVASVRHAFK